MSRRKRTTNEIVIEAAGRAAPIFRWCDWRWTTHNAADREEREVPSAARIAATLIDLVERLRQPDTPWRTGTGRFTAERDPEGGEITIALQLCTLPGPDDWEPEYDVHEDCLDVIAAVVELIDDDPPPSMIADAVGRLRHLLERAGRPYQPANPGPS